MATKKRMAAARAGAPAAIRGESERGRSRTAPEQGDGQHLWQLLAENTSDFIRLLGVDGQSVYASPSVGRLYGRVPATLFEFAHPEDVERCQWWWNHVLAGNKDRLVWRGRAADGNWRWLETSPVLVPYHGQPHVLTVCRDVTERKDSEDRLRQNERLLAEAARIAHVGFWENNMDADQITWSDETCRIAGLPGQRSPFKLSELRERIHPDDRLIHALAFDRAKRGDAPYDLEYRMVRPDGEVRFVHSVGEVVRDDTGRPRRAFGVVQDITERKRADNALRESEQRWRSLTEALPQLVWSATPDGACDYFSTQWTEHTGVALEKLLGWGWLETVHPEDRESTKQCWLESVAERRRYDVECRIRRHDGEYCWFKTRGVPIRDAGGTIIKWFGTDTEITDLRRAKESLRAAEQRLRHVVTSSPAVLLTIPAAAAGFQGIGWMSENVEAMLGYRVEETLGKDWWLRKVHPEDREAVVAQFRAEIISRDYSASEYRFRRKDGQYRWLRSEVRLLRDTGGHPIEVVGSLSDITERKRLEDQFRQAQKMVALGTLAGGVAHDFNNLLAVINIFTDLILNRLPPGDPMREMLGEIHKAGERSGALTRQLLAFSRQQVIEPKVLDLNKVVADTEKMLRRLIGEDVIMTTTLDPSLATVKADLGQMEQVLMNLSVNARDAMPQGGKLVIETRNVTLDEAYAATHPEVQLGRYVLLAVSDTGTGMDLPTKARLFEPFFTTKEAGKGTGLGLAVVHGIVKQSGGQVEVASEVGRGTTFKIYLPVAGERVPAGKSDRSLQQMSLGTETVLLVEDDDVLRALFRRVLQFCGYTVLDAANGREAVRVAEGHPKPVDLLVSDVVMPYLGGRQLFEQLAVTQPGLKVLFLSGYTNDAVIRHGVSQGEFAFLQKPFMPTTLVQKVRETLDQRP